MQCWQKPSRCSKLTALRRQRIVSPAPRRLRTQKAPKKILNQMVKYLYASALDGVGFANAIRADHVARESGVLAPGAIPQIQSSALPHSRAACKGYSHQKAEDLAP